MPLNDCDELLSTMQIRAMIPVASGSWTAAEMLRAATEEALTSMLPLLIRARGEYLVRTTDLSTTQGTALLRLPYRAAALREVKRVATDGTESKLTLLDPEKVTEMEGVSTQQGTPKYAVFEDGAVRLLPTPQLTGETIRVKWHIRPSRMTAVSNTSRISAIAADTPSPGTTRLTVGAIPAAMNAITSVDFVRGQNRHEILDFDQTVSALSTGGTTIDIATSALPTGPDALAVGDYVAAAGYTPFPNFPVECHSAIALRGAAAVVGSKGDKTLADSLRIEAASKEASLLNGILTPRSHGNTRKMVNRRFF